MPAERRECSNAMYVRADTEVGMYKSRLVLTKATSTHRKRKSTNAGGRYRIISQPPYIPVLAVLESRYAQMESKSPLSDRSVFLSVVFTPQGPACVAEIAHVDDVYDGYRVLE